MKKISTRKGLTLVELLIAIFILTVGVSGVLLFYTNAMQATEYAKDLTIATAHAEYTFEEMRTRDSLADIATTDWTAWAQNEWTQSDTLPQEALTVAIVDVDANPLDITATIGWTRHSNNYAIALKTQITK